MLYVHTPYVLAGTCHPDADKTCPGCIYEHRSVFLHSNVPMFRRVCCDVPLNTSRTCWYTVLTVFASTVIKLFNHCMRTCFGHASLHSSHACSPALVHSCSTPSQQCKAEDSITLTWSMRQQRTPFLLHSEVLNADIPHQGCGQ